jgi:Ca2+-transporting ATPase
MASKKPRTVKGRLHQAGSRLVPPMVRLWTVPLGGLRRFWHMEGLQWGAAFGFHALFALFPLVLLFVTGASNFVDRDQAAGQLIAYLERFTPLTEAMQAYIFETVSGVIRTRGPVGSAALVILVWLCIDCFGTLILAGNRAYGSPAYPWWRLQLKSLSLLAITAASIGLGILVPLLIPVLRLGIFGGTRPEPGFQTLLAFSIPVLLAFLDLVVLYKVLPRRSPAFAQVWAPALTVLILLVIAERLFVGYLQGFSALNAVYGAFGAIMALLLWVYISGCILIYGTCLCAVEEEGLRASGPP